MPSWISCGAGAQREQPRLGGQVRDDLDQHNNHPALVLLRTTRGTGELHATSDVRRICDLFGIGIEAAMHYAATLG